MVFLLTRRTISIIPSITARPSIRVTGSVVKVTSAQAKYCMPVLSVRWMLTANGAWLFRTSHTTRKPSVSRPACSLVPLVVLWPRATVAPVCRSISITECSPSIRVMPTKVSSSTSISCRRLVLATYPPKITKHNPNDSIRNQTDHIVVLKSINIWFKMLRCL